MIARDKNKYLKIRSGSGVGDNIYLYSIVKEFVRQGYKLDVCTKWPTIFDSIKKDVKISQFTKVDIDINAHYSNRKQKKETDQFQDSCINVGLWDIPLHLDWEIHDSSITNNILKLANGRKIVYVQSPRSPMGRSDGFGMDLLPNFSVLDFILSHKTENHFVILRGSKAPLYNLKNIDYVVTTSKGPSDVIDIGSMSDMFIGQVGQIIPMAESFDKPYFILWSRKGLNSDNPFISSITPQKILHKKHLSINAIDDHSREEISKLAKEFFK